MRNMTRDPFHPYAGSIYVKNIMDLRISVDGESLDSQFVVNVYRSVSKPGGPYVELFELDDEGKIVEENGTFKVRKVYGPIEVEGNPVNCDCWAGKLIDRWWDKINDRRPGW